MKEHPCSAEELEPPGTRQSPVISSDAEIPQPFVNETVSLLKIPKPLLLIKGSASHVPTENPRTRAFRRRFFPKTTRAQWNDWRWQLRNRITTVEGLGRIIRLSEDERAAVKTEATSLPVAITPYYASLMDESDPCQAIRRTVIPVTDEYCRAPGEAQDPLGEDRHSPVPGLVHRYPDRVLVMVTEFCSTYCRYCTRSRLVGKRLRNDIHPDYWEHIIAYIASRPEIRDVLLSGGDPMTLSDDQLEYLLFRLRQIPHVEMLRIGTKVPVVLPHRITAGLSRMLRRYHPLYLSIHFTHPDELTVEVQEACSRLANAGIPLGSQTVLLAGINDRVEIMKRLFQGLLKIRVRPYYLYQCDPIWGSAHFRTPVGKGLEIIRGLRGHTSGYAVPAYVIDAPGGGGKIPLLPQYVVGRRGNDLLLKNYMGDIYRYDDPGGFLEQKEPENETRH